MILQQLRSYRIYGIALFDLFTAVIGIFMFTYIVSSTLTYSQRLLWSVVFVIPVGVATHFILGIPTTLNYYLGISRLP